MNPRIIISLAVLFLAGCATQPMTSAEWQRKIREEKQAKELGISYEFKSDAQLRKEAAEQRRQINDIMRDVMNTGAGK